MSVGLRPPTQSTLPWGHPARVVVCPASSLLAISPDLRAVSGRCLCVVLSFGVSYVAALVGGMRVFFLCGLGGLYWASVRCTWVRRAGPVRVGCEVLALFLSEFRTLPFAGFWVCVFLRPALRVSFPWGPKLFAFTFSACFVCFCAHSPAAL